MPAIRLGVFDTWNPGYGLASVRVCKAGTGGSQLASIFTDEALTVAAVNPQTLQQLLAADISYGRWAQPLYTGEPVELQINAIDFTGIIRPALTTLAGVDASQATGKVTGGEKDIALAEHLARRVDVRDFGDFIAVGGQGASAATNNATLTNAIGAIAALGGGFVELPGGTYLISSFTLPQGVVVRGLGRGASILQSTLAGVACTIGGVRAGLSRLTLDGVQLVDNSIGLYAEDKDQIVLDDVEIKRFNLGLHRNGGGFCNWRDFFIANCVDGYRGDGNDDELLTVELRFDRWIGGAVENCSGIALRLKNDGQPCHHQIIEGVRFEGNTGTAVQLSGARAVSFPRCSWEDNTIDLDIADGSPETETNTMIGVEFSDGSIKDGAVNLSGNLEAIALRRMDLEDVTITITTPGHNILVEDCREISGVTIAGDATAWQRKKTGDHGASSGVTTGNSATKAWAITLDPGQKVYIVGKVIGRQRNGINTGFYHLAVSAGRPGATLAYDTQTANFTVGDILTGATSGATGRIVADSDSGATGSLTLQDVVGEFIDDEIITGVSGGSATANGALSLSNAALAGSVAALRAAQETNVNWNATFAANGPQIELQVTGDTGQTVEWTVDVDVVST